MMANPCGISSLSRYRIGGPADEQWKGLHLAGPTGDTTMAERLGDARAISGRDAQETISQWS